MILVQILFTLKNILKHFLKILTKMRALTYIEGVRRYTLIIYLMVTAHDIFRVIKCTFFLKMV